MNNSGKKIKGRSLNKKMIVYSKNSDINYFILILLIISKMVSYEVTFVLCFSYVIYLFLKKKFIIPKTRIIGIKLLISYLIIATLIGLFHLNLYGLNSIIRDIFYVLSAVITILLGSYLSTGQRNKKDLVKTMLIWAMVQSGIMVFQIISNIDLMIHSSNIWALKSEIGTGSEIIPMSLAIILMRNSFDLERYFSRKIEMIFIFFYLTVIVFSFSRTMIVVFITSIAILFTCSPNRTSISSKKAKKFLSGILILIVVFASILYFIPNGFLVAFIDKSIKSLTEISPNLDWNSAVNITQNWRGYEIHQASEVFKNGNLFNQLFGFGFGKLIPVNLSELVGVPSLQGGIPILHNGYFMILIKGGIFGLTMLIMYFIQNIIVAIKAIKYKTVVWESSLLLSVIFCTVVTTYSTTGLFKAGTGIEINIMIGWISSMILKNLKNVKVN